MEKLNSCYKNKNVLITGHTGFKGSWLSIWLRELGAKVIGYGLEPIGENDNFILAKLSNKIVDIRGDIRDYHRLKGVFESYNPDIVFHLAAQPLVRESYENPVYTYETNVMGTINVLECIRQTPNTKVGILVTTDKCYENKEQVWGYRENDPMGGYDPYSSSKAAAEIAIQSWRDSFMNPHQYAMHGKTIASVRAGNVIGGGDWSKHRIIPDCIRDLENERPINIRNPKAIRPWQHVLEPLSGYLLLGQKLMEDPIYYSGAWNFGPQLESVVSVWHVASQLIKFYGRGELLEQSTESLYHEANLLSLDISKSYFQLGWRPVWNIKTAIYYTIDWYKNYMDQDGYKLCIKHINEFLKQWEEE